MSYIQINADFPGIRSDEMNEVYKRLESGQWKKMHDHHGTMNTTWVTWFPPDVPDHEAIKNAQETFMSCCSPYCRPLMIMQRIQNEPDYSNAR